jgi:MFS transporter, DHA1 family, tetracycline resistance protein
VRRAALPFIFVTLMLDVMGIGLIIPVAPKLIAQLDVGGDAAHHAAMYGWLTATYALMLFLFAPFMGSLSDKVGRRPVILIALLGTGLDYFAMAFAPNLTILFITRALNGMSGASMAASMAYIADVTPPEKRAAGYGMVGAAFGVGFVLGPLLGGYLGSIDLRLPFMVAGGFALASWLYGFFILPESLAPENRRSFSWARANPIGALVSISRFPRAISLAIAMFFLQLAMFGLHSTWVLYTEHRYKWDEFAVGLSLAVVGLSSAIVQGGLARVAVPKFGERRCLLFGVAIAVLAYAGYGLATEGWMIYCIIALASIGGVAGPAGQALLSKSVEPNQQGELQGSLSSMQSVAQVIAPLAATKIFALSLSGEGWIRHPGASFFWCALLAGVGLAVAWWSLRQSTGASKITSASDPPGG